MWHLERRALLVSVIAIALVLSGCNWNWKELRFGADGTGFNPHETQLGVANVANLRLGWTGLLGYTRVVASPAVANGVAFLGAHNGKFYAFDATGARNCSGSPTECTPLWRAVTPGLIESSAAVSNGIVYVGAYDPLPSSLGGDLWAFDATGTSNCSGYPKTCTPLWTAALPADPSTSSPIVLSGLVYMEGGGSVFVFDASGTTGCTGVPKTCTPLWSYSAGGLHQLGEPSIANGVLYADSDGQLYAFDATGNTNCSGSPKTCAPLWITNAAGLGGPPAVSNGIVYQGGGGGQLYAFDAAGNTNCSGSPKTCAPLWTGSTNGGFLGAPAVDPAIGSGVVYVGSGFGNLYAFDAAGNTNCSGLPKTCSPLDIDLIPSGAGSSPAVANGLVYVGAFPGKVYAFDAVGSVNCSGVPNTCNPLWSGSTGTQSVSSPAVVNAVVYIAGNNGVLYGFSLT